MSKPKMPKFPWTFGGVPAKHCFQIFKARDGWRWRMWARNGRLVAESGEAYQGVNTCSRMAKMVRGDRKTMPVWLP
jgi:uncharacterized protein YegP (UPF0339 family)